MFIHLIIWIFQFCLLIQKAYSFRTPKHDLVFYYKTFNNVFIANPSNHTTSYGIYVAGQTITIDIPTSVVDLSDIAEWKVANLNKDRLMFVYKKKPQIMINRKTIKNMKFSGELSGPIIAFGDNEALHVPTISNPEFTKPDRQWNYIELLYFDDQSEKVSVIRSLPWLKDDDWKYIKEWKMMDYIHFDDKLYLAIKRSIRNEKTSNVTQEISIIRMCLDKGSELISSAVDIHFTRPEFNTNHIIFLWFVFSFGPSGYELHTRQLPSFSKIGIDRNYIIRDFVSLFEETANKCASGSNEITLLQYHLRSEFGKCTKTNNESCSTTLNIVPSRNIAHIVTELVIVKYVSEASINVTLTIINISPFFSMPYPFENRGRKYPSFYRINKRPYGLFFPADKKIVFRPIDVCYDLKTCTNCILYGLYFDCIWSTSICTRNDETKDKKALTLNNCFKIIAFSPLIFNSSSPTNLTIQLDRPLHIQASQEHLVIQAGDNHCTDIMVNGSSINCSMSLTKSGEFKIHVSLRNDRYADTSIISALSTDNVHIVVSKGRFMIVMPFLIFSIFTTFLFIVYTNYNKKHLNEFIEFKRSAKIMKIAIKSQKSKKFSFTS